MSLGGSAHLTGLVRAKGSGNGGRADVSGTMSGSSFSTVFADLPADTNDAAYGYAANMAVFTLDLDAVYDADAYPISYELDGGTNDSRNPSSYTVDDAIRLRPATKDGYVFAGWYLDAEHTNRTNTVPLNHLGPITFYAAWTDAPSEDVEHAPQTVSPSVASGSNASVASRKSLANTGEPAWTNACAVLVVGALALLFLGALGNPPQRLAVWRRNRS